MSNNQVSMIELIRMNMPEVIKESEDATMVFVESAKQSIKAFEKIVMILIKEKARDAMIEDAVDFMDYANSDFVKEIMRGFNQEERFNFILESNDQIAIDRSRFLNDMVKYQEKVKDEVTRAALHIVPGMDHPMELKVNVTVK